jgi:hypothetical protein
MIKSIMISVTDEYLEKINQVADSLTKAGMEVEQTFSITGIISGQISEDKISSLQQIPGVGSVELEKTVTTVPLVPNP